MAGVVFAVSPVLEKKKKTPSHFPKRGFSITISSSSIGCKGEAGVHLGACILNRKYH
jgi:hypothetical protein